MEVINVGINKSKLNISTIKQTCWDNITPTDPVCVIYEKKSATLTKTMQIRCEYDSFAIHNAERSFKSSKLRYRIINIPTTTMLSQVCMNQYSSNVFRKKLFFFKLHCQSPWCLIYFLTLSPFSRSNIREGSERDRYREAHQKFNQRKHNQF